jgi:hypothetical protein
MVGSFINELYCVDLGSEIQRVEMKLRNQILLVNAGITGGLVLEVYRGAPLPVIAGVGCVLFLMANAIFLFRWKNLSSGEHRGAKSAPTDRR